MVHFDVEYNWGDNSSHDLEEVDLSPPTSTYTFGRSHTYTSLGTYNLTLTANCINDGAGIGHDFET